MISGSLEHHHLGAPGLRLGRRSNLATFPPPERGFMTMNGWRGGGTSCSGMPRVSISRGQRHAPGAHGEDEQARTAEQREQQVVPDEQRDHHEGHCQHDDEAGGAPPAPQRQERVRRGHEDDHRARDQQEQPQTVRPRGRDEPDGAEGREDEGQPCPPGLAPLLTSAILTTLPPARRRRQAADLLALAIARAATSCHLAAAARARTIRGRLIR